MSGRVASAVIKIAVARALRPVLDGFVIGGSRGNRSRARDGRAGTRRLW